MYGEDVLRQNRRRRVVPEVDAEADLVVEDAESGFCGSVMGFELSRGYKEFFREFMGGTFRLRRSAKMVVRGASFAIAG